MRSADDIAADAVRALMTHEPDVRIIANVRADELMRALTPALKACPMCGRPAPFTGSTCLTCVVLTSLR